MTESLKGRSILESIRPLCQVSECDSSFDSELIPLINSTFLVLKQLKVGPQKGFAITGTSETWGDFGEEDYMEALPSYVGAKVRIVFDPPANATVLQALKDYVSEFEFRLNSEGEYGG